MSIRWKDDVADHDYDAALRYLSLELDEHRATAVVKDLRRAKVTPHRANDLVRAVGRPVLDLHDLGVHRNMVKAIEGRELSPILIVSFQPRGADIADGFHRLCFAYWYDPWTVIPGRVATVPA